MLVRVATFTPYGVDIAIVLVESPHTEVGNGAAMLAIVEKHIRSTPIMLISIQENGYRAYATFRTEVLLALLQLEIIHFTPFDLHQPVAALDVELPF